MHDSFSYVEVTLTGVMIQLAIGMVTIRLLTRTVTIPPPSHIQKNKTDNISVRDKAGLWETAFRYLELLYLCPGRSKKNCGEDPGNNKTICMRP
jgi:hypothetical protein